MFLRKLFARALLIFAVFYLFTRPVSAADLVNRSVIVLHIAADNVAGFISRLN
ncbi:hypothetical protein [Planotetraspora phitsanulokensis]|uniref:Uncharacterized protein n=1 Tax=Planotetraspora phitsanulokensis TaxID=575192 RepID=A0A8J3XH72_9ACTN|nr:hypothetical protein [Planotetraspora phitsanulokensis]GII40924.1 hypothetical protein Pph01_59270 [Planotetraspora phitsanulokensis]